MKIQNIKDVNVINCQLVPVGSVVSVPPGPRHGHLLQPPLAAPHSIVLAAQHLVEHAGGGLH